MTVRNWIAARRELEHNATEGPWTPAEDWAAIASGADSVAHGYYKGDCPACGDFIEDDAFIAIEPEDAEFIADARTALPISLDVLEEVLELHHPQERCYNGDGSWSVTRDVWDEDYEGEPEVFVVCAHCGAIEMHESTGDEDYHTYVDSLWPCPTMTAFGRVMT